MGSYILHITLQPTFFTHHPYIIDSFKKKQKFVLSAKQDGRYRNFLTRANLTNVYRANVP